MECYSRIVVQGLLLPNYWTYDKLRKSEDEDPKHPSYSLTEVALYPAVSGVSEAYSIGRKLDTGHYEIFNYQHQNAYSDGSVIFVNEEIEYMIDYANILGGHTIGSSGFEYGHKESNNGCDQYQGRHQHRIYNIHQH